MKIKKWLKNMEKKRGKVMKIKKSESKNDRRKYILIIKEINQGKEE